MDKTTFEKRKKVIYDLICDDLYVPMKIKEIAIILQIPKEQREDLKEVLDALVVDGKIEISKRGKYSKATKKRITGTFVAHAKGFGFVELEDSEEDIYIPESEIHGAFHKDTVEVELIKGEQNGKRKEGRIVQILARGIETVVGTYEESKNFGFVCPDNLKFTQDIFIPLRDSKGAVDGHKVVVKITDYGDKRRNPEGKVVEIIGHINDPGTDILSIVKAYDIPYEFSEKILNQAERVGKEVSDADRAGRMDLRAWQTVTIDGEDAKDLDDAITLSMEGDKYKLGVHIADVTNYVQERSALDVEALKRGTSVYLVDRVIPMLPHILSNGICSLNAGVDRLTLSCIMWIDKKGNIVDHKITESVINVDRRMSYTSVRKILTDKEEKEIEEYKELVPMFQLMEELAGLLREKRRKRGSIDFDFPESKIILDKSGKPLEIKPYERNVATRIIEDFMLAANETVAEDFFWQEIPFVYRSHENPDPDKLLKLGTFIHNFGYSIHIGQDEVHPKEVQKLLDKIEGSEEEDLIARLTLRSMKQAKYTVTSDGHFGLATKYYCHFTSPIRRYPDLQIHRIIKETLRGRMNEERKQHYEKILPDVAKQSSEMERRAEEAERETNKLKKVEYMEEHMGQVFEGVISSITAWGMYVELPNTIEGLVHIASIEGDYYVFKEDTYELVGEHTNKHYKLGEKVYVMVSSTDRVQRTIDFKLVDKERLEYGQTEEG